MEPTKRIRAAYAKEGELKRRAVQSSIFVCPRCRKFLTEWIPVVTREQMRNMGKGGVCLPHVILQCYSGCEKRPDFKPIDIRMPGALNW